MHQWSSRFVSRSWAMFLFIYGSVSFTSCGSDEKRPEVVEKFRALGVATNPVIAKPGDNVELTFLVAGGKGKGFSLKYFQDTEASYAVPVAPVEKASSLSEQTLGSVSVFSFKATVAIDAASPLILGSIAKAGKARVRYGVQLIPQSEPEDEKIVGDVLVYAPTAPEVATVAPTISIENLSNNAALPAGSTQNLIAKVTSSSQENFRIGWFVSDGEIKNRRARETEWKVPNAGEHTLIVTARGMSTGAFAYSALKINVQ